jgi:calcineurin-like phosphoesterase family protein
LFGHSHGKLPPYGKSFDIGVDCHNYKPLSLDEVVEKMRALPDNRGLVADEPAPQEK